MLVEVQTPHKIAQHEAWRKVVLGWTHGNTKEEQKNGAEEKVALRKIRNGLRVGVERSGRGVEWAKIKSPIGSVGLERRLEK